MALTNAQLTMLDCLIYSGFVTDGKTVGQIADEIKAVIESGGTVSGASMSNEEWLTLVNSIRSDSTLSGYVATQCQNDSSTGFCAACFVDDLENPQDVNVVFRGTSCEYEWHDNAQGGYLSDTEQQQASADYINSLPERFGDCITVSGHSKGGNRAQYVTIVTNRVGRCVSVDGQGFSQEFIDKYGQVISERSGMITSISAEWDYVNCLLIPIAGTVVYIQTEIPSDPLLIHKPNLLLDENGNLGPTGQQSPLSSMITQYTTYVITHLEEPLRSATIDGLIQAVVDLPNGGLGNLKPATYLAGLVAILNVDNCVFDYIGEHYGIGAQLFATGLLASAFPVLFLDDFLNAGKELVEAVIGKMNDIAVTIGNAINALGNAIYGLGQAFVGAVSSFLSGIHSAFNQAFNHGYQQASANPYIYADTARLRNYADRLQNLNRRIVELDRRMDSLYTKVGLRDLLSLLRADLMTGYNWRISNCMTYLRETANDLESVERGIRSLY